MGGGQRRTIICGCGKHIKGSVREVIARSKIHAKVCELIDGTDLHRPFEYGMNGMNGVDVSRRGVLQHRPLTGVATAEREELFRDDVKVIELLQSLQQRGFTVEEL